MVQFTQRGKEKLLFKLLDSHDNGKLMKSYKGAAKRYKKEQEASAAFDAGAYGGQADQEELDQYKQWLKEKFITQEEYQILLNQQVTQLDEHLTVVGQAHGHLSSQMEELAYLIVGVCFDTCVVCQLVVRDAWNHMFSARLFLCGVIPTATIVTKKTDFL